VSDLKVVAHTRVTGGRPVERLVCHRRLPLVAGLDRHRPAVHVWDCGGGRPHEIGSIGAGSADYAADRPWTRSTPAVAWHPEQPLLLVAGGDGVLRWTPTGLAPLDGVPATATYRALAFSPDGRALWASPSSGGGDDAWQRSDVLDLGAGAVRTAPRWDTGVVEHPGGGLVVTLASDQGATHGIFARVDGAAMRVLRRALVLDADGYETPVFSADGRHLAIRGDAYGNSLTVFEFPSLRRVLATTLGEPTPDYPYPAEWLERMGAWSRHNVAFGPGDGAVWVGTPTGTLLEVDVRDGRAVGHDVLDGSPVTALAATAAGDLVVACGDGDLLLLSVRAGGAQAGPPDEDAARAAVMAFVQSTSEVPEGADVEDHLVVTDGTRAWTPDDLDEVTGADEADPSWLRFRAMLHEARAREE
jgi:hypothetical protein